MFIYITAGLAAYILSVLLHLLYILTFSHILFLEGCRVTPLHPRWLRHWVWVVTEGQWASEATARRMWCAGAVRWARGRERIRRERVKFEVQRFTLDAAAEVNEGPPREEDGRCCRTGLPEIRRWQMWDKVTEIVRQWALANWGLRRETGVASFKPSIIRCSYNNNTWVDLQF